MRTERAGIVNLVAAAMIGCAALATLASGAAPAPDAATFGPGADSAMEGPTLVVTGHGEVSVPPDRAVLSVGVSVQDVTAEQAQAKTNDKMNSIVEALKKANVPMERIQTSRADLLPVFEQRQFNDGREPQVIAYRCSNTVRVELDDLKRVGAILDATIKAGANQVQSVGFEVKNDAAARKDALTKAVKDAREKAETIAAALGGSVGEVLEAGEPNVSSGPQPWRAPGGVMARMSSDVAASPMPVLPGQIGVSASVSVRYAYKKP